MQTFGSTVVVILFDELPKERCWGGREFYNWEGFWYRSDFLSAAISTRSYFKARDDDVILASSMKTGTTWLKALIPSIMHRKQDHNDAVADDDSDPLIKNHPNSLMPSFEVQIFKENPKADLSGMPSPRLFRTHVPYMMLPDSVKESGCRIVYITRDPKDAFVSLWHFINANARPEQGVCALDESFESYCEGIHHFGPFHDHVLSYWKESLKRPEKILFLKYEELKRDPKCQVQKLASFLGRPFVDEEEIDKIIWRCSLERLKNLEVNKNGTDPNTGIFYKSYFRKGSVGDWKNFLSEEMKERLDNITRMKLEGSGLDL
ncbi:cytosolic sulfotransferase 5-like [Tripterygium wilfordii]|uniref:cytosolic sulfotransferase 5-like n=1 Tax=Tripterygium wilfordii TaxID=458696 RepID=UPI0018F8030A|nr:cytosolic sulfotransferase 5-like [Tripterygium wilfordii]